MWNAGNGISFAVGKSSGWASSSSGCYFFFFFFCNASNILGGFPRSLLSFRKVSDVERREGEDSMTGIYTLLLAELNVEFER